jgi:hypothetical protein
MSFSEIRPEKSQQGTGVRATYSNRVGLLVSLYGEALKALLDAEKVRIFVDNDGARPVARIVADAEGPFLVTRLSRGKGAFKRLRLGRMPEWRQAQPFERIDCSWDLYRDEIKPAFGLEVELPRELLPSTSPPTARLPQHSAPSLASAAYQKARERVLSRRTFFIAAGSGTTQGETCNTHHRPTSGSASTAPAKCSRCPRMSATRV